MTRPTLAVTAVLCALLAGCPAEEPEAVAPVPAPVAAERAAPAPPKLDRATIEASVVGEQVADLGTQWFHGEPTSVDGTQLVVFFEVWCPHCRREAPRLQKLADTLGAEGLQVVGLTRMSKGVTEEQLDTFIDENALAYPIGRPADGLAQQLKIRGIPAAAVLKDGEVVWRGHPARLSEDQIKGWL